MIMVRQYRCFVFTVALVVLFSFHAYAGRTVRNDATVTMIHGAAYAHTTGEKAAVPIKKNDTLSKDQEVRVGKKSRIEIRFPDGTMMRLAENSRIHLREIPYDKKQGSKKLKVDLLLGKLWANVRRLLTPDSAVEVKTANAVAGVRGTVYRVNVEEDTSAMVKVYEGSVFVAGRPQQISKTASEVSGPVPVPGPHEVPPPHHEVTREEWEVIVQSMQQISISPQGVASKPQTFSPADDADDWVQWNQGRDKGLAL